ncbi:MAG TPA: type II toxin-antitoxin system VapC family toxin [Candidatus Humimicrobiaceae bacterium]
MGRFIKKMTGYNNTEEQINNDIFIISESIIKSFNEKVRVVLDTSVIVKWFFKDDEKNIKKADLILKQYLNNEIKIIIPELSAFELANVLRNKIKKYQNVNLDIIDRLYNLGIIFYIDKEILKIATKIAADINESVYDCIFIATAERFNCKLVTDNNSLFLNYAGYSSRKIEILLLEDYPE